MRLGDVARGAAERSARRAEDVAQLGDVLLAHVVDGVSSEPALLSAIAKVRKKAPGVARAEVATAAGVVEIRALPFSNAVTLTLPAMGQLAIDVGALDTAIAEAQSGNLSSQAACGALVSLAALLPTPAALSDVNAAARVRGLRGLTAVTSLGPVRDAREPALGVRFDFEAVSAPPVRVAELQSDVAQQRALVAKPFVDLFTNVAFGQLLRAEVAALVLDARALRAVPACNANGVYMRGFQFNDLGVTIAVEGAYDVVTVRLPYEYARTFTVPGSVRALGDESKPMARRLAAAAHSVSGYAGGLDASDPRHQGGYGIGAPHPEMVQRVSDAAVAADLGKITRIVLRRGDETEIWAKVDPALWRGLTAPRRVPHFDIAIDAPGLGAALGAAPKPRALDEVPTCFLRDPIRRFYER